MAPKAKAKSTAERMRNDSLLGYRSSMLSNGNSISSSSSTSYSKIRFLANRCSQEAKAVADAGTKIAKKLKGFQKDNTFGSRGAHKRKKSQRFHKTALPIPVRRYYASMMDWVSRVRVALSNGQKPPEPDFLDYPSEEDLKPKNKTKKKKQKQVPVGDEDALVESVKLEKKHKSVPVKIEGSFRGMGKSAPAKVEEC